MEGLKTLDSPKEVEKDEAQLFADTLAIKLRRLSNYQMAMAQAKLLAAVTEIEYTTPREPPQPQSYRSNVPTPNTAQPSMRSQLPPAPLNMHPPVNTESAWTFGSQDGYQLPNVPTLTNL